jgi:enoyl-CoA hydratase/carnithine racemase
MTMDAASVRLPVLLQERGAGVATLTLNRPAQRNALDAALLDALCDALEELGSASEVHAVVLAANGPAFCAGHDLREIRAHDDRDWQARLFRRCGELMLRIARLPVPVIARVHGMATAAGCQLVATCDLAIAGESARFATPGVNIGLFCTTPMVALTRAIQPKHALELLFTGQPIDAAEAARIGLVNRAVPDAELDAAVSALACTLAQKSRAVLARGKRAFQRQRDLDLDAAYADACETMASDVLTPEANEGIGAFLHKRKPRWPAP